MTVRSLYEQLFPLTTVMKQRVVENFDGDTLNERWTTRNVAGTNTFVMDDVVDDGFKITTGTVTNDRGLIYFNDIRQYTSSACVFIGVMRTPETTNWRTHMGMTDRNTLDQVSNIRGAFASVGNQFANYTLIHDDGTQIATQSSIARDTVFHNHKIIFNSATDVKYFIDGALEVTVTTNIPAAGTKMQPAFCSRNATNAARTGHIRFLEVYNT